MPQPEMRPQPFAGPIHAILLAFPLALFCAALVSDLAYLNTAVIQWTNFSAWLIAAATVFSGILLGWSIVSLFFGRFRRARRAAVLYALLVGGMFLGGLFNSFQHAKDGWLSVGTTGLLLSILCSVLALAAAWLAHSRVVDRRARA